MLFVPEDSIELPITPAFALRGYLHTPAVILWSGKSRPGYLFTFLFRKKNKVRPNIKELLTAIRCQFRRFEGKPNTDVRNRVR